MNTTKYTYKQKVKTFSDSQLFGLEMTPYLNIQYPEWERGEEGSWGKNSLVKCCTHGIILLHFSPLHCISKHRGGGAAGRMTVGQKVRTGVLRSRKVRAGVLKENSNFELFLSCTIQNWLH